MLEVELGTALLQAALQGQGVGLGWTPLIDAMIESKALVRLSPIPLTSERGSL